MTRAEQNLLKIQGIFFFAASLAGIFLNVFLFRLGGLSFAVEFNLISLIFLLLWYVSSGWLYRKFESVKFMRLSFLLFVLLFFLLFFLKEQAVNFLIILGIINGTAHGNFWAANNLAQYMSTFEKTRHHYFGRLNFWTNISRTLGPITGGFIILITEFIFQSNLIAYSLLFLITSLLMVYLFFKSREIPSFKNIEFKISDILNHKRSRDWKIVLFQQTLTGLWDVAFSTLSGILIYLIVKEEIFLGGVSTIGALVFAFASLWAAKNLQKNKKLFLIGAILAPLGLLIFALQQNWIGILALIVITKLFLPYLDIPSSKVIYDVIDKVNLPWQKKYHFLIERDLSLGLARIISYLILIFFFIGGNQIQIAKNWITIVPIFPFLIGLSFFLFTAKKIKKIVLNEML